MNGYGFLRQPRWLALGFLVVVIVPSFILLSRWQLSRLDERRHYNAVVTANASTPPVPVGQLLDPGADISSVGDAVTWRQVSATGHYDQAHQVLVRKRPLQGRNGFWVATPFVTDSGTVLVVDRGWVEAVSGAGATPDVPPAPAGRVSIVGRIRVSEQAPRPQPTDLPAGQVTDLDVRLVAGGAPAYPAYVDLVSSTPPDSTALTPIPLPELDDGPHLSYAMQWILFAVVAVVGFVVLARREAYGDPSDAAGGAGAGAGTGGPGAPGASAAGRPGAAREVPVQDAPAP